MGPAPLNVPASPSPNKSPKVAGPGVNGAAKQPTTAAAKNLAPSDISSPHELTAFVRLPNPSCWFERADVNGGDLWVFMGIGRDAA